MLEKRNFAKNLKLVSKNAELMIHWPFWSDLLPNDFLSPKNKHKMRGERFVSPESAVEAFRIPVSENASEIGSSVSILKAEA